MSPIAELLNCYRFRYQSETELQDAIEFAFKTAYISNDREFRLNERDCPDFFCASTGLAIEVKIKGSASDVLRQLGRYAQHEKVRALLLVTTRSLQAAQIPSSINGKPLEVVCLRSL